MAHKTLLLSLTLLAAATSALAASERRPETAPPGTPEKMAVLELRAKLKFALWHPLDAQYEGDPRPLEAILRRRAALAS